MEKKQERVTSVAIGVPSGDMVHASFCMALVSLAVRSMASGIAVCLINQNSSIVEVGRNMLVETAKQIGSDYILFLDSDMVFHAELLIELLARKKDIICCDAVRRRPPYSTVVKKTNGEAVDHTKDKGIVELTGASAATLLVNMKVFEEIEEPYFLVEWRGNKEFLGEDYYFSNKARIKGYGIYCDVDASKRIGHSGTVVHYIPKA